MLYGKHKHDPSGGPSNFRLFVRNRCREYIHSNVQRFIGVPPIFSDISPRTQIGHLHHRPILFFLGDGDGEPTFGVTDPYLIIYSSFQA